MWDRDVYSKIILFWKLYFEVWLIFFGKVFANSHDTSLFQIHMFSFSLEKSSCIVIFRSVYIFPHAFQNEKCTRATSWMFNSTFCAYDVGWKEIEIKPLSFPRATCRLTPSERFSQASFGNVNSPTFQQTLRRILVSASGSWGHPLSTSVPLCQSWGCFIWWGPQLSGR